MLHYIIFLYICQEKVFLKKQKALIFSEKISAFLCT